VDMSGLSAAQKKKLKKKMKEKEKAGAAPAAAASAPKKESAVAKKIREAQARMRAEEEALRLRREEEERAAKEEEEKLLEEERRKEEARRRKRDKEKAKKEQMRKDGTLLSKTEKEKAKRAGVLRDQLIASGQVPSAADAGKPKKVVYDNRKKKKGKTLEEEAADELAALEVAKKEPAVDEEETGESWEEPEVKEPEDAPVEAEQSEDDVGDDWEDEDWEEKADQIVVGPMDEEDAPEVKSKKEIEAAAKADEEARKQAEEKAAAKAKAKAAKEEAKEQARLERAKKAKANQARKAAKAAANESESSSEESESDSDSDSDDSDASDEETRARQRKDMALRRALVIKRRRDKIKTAMAARSRDNLRAPIIAILGHVDTGKTKILDKIRRTNVQDAEAGGITQQIGATFFPIEAVKKEADKLNDPEMEYKIPSLLVIDTPGHESFTNLRSRGSSLCDVAILVVDIVHGLEPQTLESIELLKLKRTPFVVALNKIDRMFGWEAHPGDPSKGSIESQKKHTQDEFWRRVDQIKLEFAEQGLNAEVYWKNQDQKRTISLVPTSAITGEGIPDLLGLLVKLSQGMLVDRLMLCEALRCTTLEVKVIDGMGTTLDVILEGGTLTEGSTMVVCGLNGPIVTTIRALVTPHPMKEMRVKGQYLHHKEIRAAQGVKICADGLEHALAGTELFVAEEGTEDELDYLKGEVMKDMQTILESVSKSDLGVYVQASTLGSLEALLEFLRTSKIPVSGVNIGPLHKKDVVKASTMLVRKKEFAVILAFDVKVESEAQEIADDLGVQIFTADIIYHLFDQFTKYMENVKKKRKEEASLEVNFPSIIKIIPQYVFNKKDPIIVGVDIEEGVLMVGTLLAVLTNDKTWLDIGRVTSIERDKKSVTSARRGESVSLKIQGKPSDNVAYGRHFDHTHTVASRMTRKSIDLLKENFRDELGKDDWVTVVKLKKMFGIA